MQQAKIWCAQLPNHSMQISFMSSVNVIEMILLIGFAFQSVCHFTLTSTFFIIALKLF